MAEEIKEEVVKEVIPSELDLLKERADIMGIGYHPNIGVAKLKEKIANKEDEGDSVLAASDAAAALQEVNNQPESVHQIAARKRAASLRLVRIRIADMNPVNGNLKSVIISAGNRNTGFVKKCVPFNVEDGWHVPQIILTQLQNKKYMSHYEIKVGNQKIKKHKLVPQYSIEILDPLTGKELEELKQRQLMARGQ